MYIVNNLKYTVEVPTNKYESTLGREIQVETVCANYDNDDGNYLGRNYKEAQHYRHVPRTEKLKKLYTHTIF